VHIECRLSTALGHFRDMMIDVAIHLERNQKREAKAAIHEAAPRSAGEDRVTR
jgi:hypothetical protein